MTDTVLEVEVEVKKVERELIPKIHLATMESVDGKYRILMDLHEEVIVYKPGQKLLFRLTRTLPNYRDGVDFVGRATVVSKKVEENRYKTLLSIGGLLVVIESPEELPLTPTEKVYVHIAEKEGG